MPRRCPPPAGHHGGDRISSAYQPPPKHRRSPPPPPPKYRRSPPPPPTYDRQDRILARHQMPPPPPQNYGEDRISDLPDSILISIISLLPVRTLLSTSILSRRWRTLWTHATRLDFDLCSDPYRDPRHPPYRILDRVLTAHQSPNLSTCRIRDLSLRSTASRSLHRLIPLLTRKRIANLSLDYFCWDYRYDPYEILTIPTLQHLSIARYSFSWHQPPSPDCIPLRSLCLNNTTLKDESLAILISSAPLLDRLRLIHCDLLEHPHINSQTLTQLEIKHIPSLTALNIDTPALTTLMLDMLSNLRDAIINAPSLSILNSSSYYIGEEAEYVWSSTGSNTNMLLRLLKGPNLLVKGPNELFRNAKVFARLRKLFICTILSCSMDAKGLVTVLDNCIHLQELGIINTVYSDLNVASALWATKDPFFCLEHHMKSLWVKGFTGRYLEVEFLRFILTKSLKLKRVVISSNESDALKVVEAILPRAPDLDIITQLEK